MIRPDRMLALAPVAGAASSRPAVRTARATADRRAVVAALAEEIDTLQQRDAARLAAYERAAAPFLAACRSARLGEIPLREAHARLRELAERWLPTHVHQEPADADAQ